MFHVNLPGCSFNKMVPFLGDKPLNLAVFRVYGLGLYGGFCRATVRGPEGWSSGEELGFGGIPDMWILISE